MRRRDKEQLIMRRVAVMGFCLFLSMGIALPAWAEKGNPEAGKALYERWCAQCHGLKGAGDGHAADLMYPRPRDFTPGMYKFRSTPSESGPTDEDIARTIRQGLRGTAMPGFGLFSDEEVKALVRYIKGYSPEVFESLEPPVPVGTPPGASKEIIEKGKKAYREAKCWECHGQEGRGDGEKPWQKDFKDKWGYRIFPRDQTHPWEYRNGTSVADIFRTITAGLTGTPMASYADSLSDDERWAIAHYVKSLHLERRSGISLRAPRVERLPESTEDPMWEKTDYLDVVMGGQILMEPRLFTPRVENVRVRALYTETDVAILLEWTDQRPNNKAGQPSDAAGIQFPAKLGSGVVKPHFGMGDRKNPVYYWFWKASAEGGTEWNARGAKQELMTPQDSSDLAVRAAYKSGLYRVMFVRKLQAGDHRNLSFQVGSFIPFALAVYDGDNREEKGKKAVSAWHYLFLEPPVSLQVYLVPPGVGVAVLLALFALARAARRRG